MAEKIITLWDHLKNITVDKGDYLGDEGWPGNWMIQKFISMDQNYIEVVNAVQGNSWQIPSSVLYRIYRDILPTRQVFLKYIKPVTKKDWKAEIVEVVQNRFEISRREAIEYIEMMSKEEQKQLLEEQGK